MVCARYGPALRILDRLAGRAILRTDLNGTLTPLTGGKQLWVETEHGKGDGTDGMGETAFQTVAQIRSGFILKS